MKFVKIKPVVNKNNGQINLSLPKKKFPKMFKEGKLKSVKINFEDLEFEL